MRLFQKVSYFLILRGHLAWHRLRHAHTDFWDHLAARLEVIKPRRMEARCLRYWLFARAVEKKEPARVCRAFRWLVTANPALQLAESHAVAVAESALWLSDRAMATRLLELIQKGFARLPEADLHRLMQMYVWRFGPDPKKAEALLDLPPEISHLPYVDLYARGQVAQSLGRTREAAVYFRDALQQMKAAGITPA